MRGLIVGWILLLLPFTIPAQVWQAVGGGMSGPPKDLYTDTSSQKMYLCGDFQYAGGLVANETVIWDGSNWEYLNPGLGFRDSCFSNICTDLQYITTRNGDLYVGGSVFYPDSSNTNWYWTSMNWYNGSVWDSCGLGRLFLKPISCNNELFALGWALATQPNNPTDNILRLNGSLWEPFGNSFDYVAAGPLTMEYYQGYYYVGGNFEKAPTKEIMRWDGTDWQPLGNGILGDAWLQQIRVYRDLLYVGGHFDQAAGNADDFLMAWDGNQWWPTFPNVQFVTQVRKMEVMDDVLYMVGEHFVYENGTWKGPYSIGKYDGAQFCSFGGNLPVFDLAGLKGKIYISTREVWNGDSLKYFAEYIGGPADEVCIPQGVPNAIQKPKGSLWEVFPNPVTDYVDIRGLITHFGNLEITLSDLQGQQIKFWNAGIQSIGNFRTRLDLGDISSGLYLITLKSDQQVSTIRLSKVGN